MWHEARIKLQLSRLFSHSCVLVLCLSACIKSDNDQTVLAFVPSSSYAVLAVNWEIVGVDNDLKRMSKAAGIEKIFQDLGVSANSVSEFAVFGDPRNSQLAKNGLIAKGTFDSEELVQSLKNRGWAETTFESNPVYINPRDGSWLTTFDEQIFVLGTPSGVREVINASTNSELQFTSKAAYKTLSSNFDGQEYPVLMIVVFPQESQDMAEAAVQVSSAVLDLAGVGPLGELLSKVGYARALGCAISHQDHSFPVALSAVMKNEESATLVSGALSILKNLGRIVSKNYPSPSDTDAARALQTMSIERSGEVIAVKMTMSREDIGAMSR